MDLGQARRLAAVALANGGQRLTLTTTEWDIAGRCQNPVVRELHTRPSPRHRRINNPLLDPKVAAILAAFPGAQVESVRRGHHNAKRKWIGVETGKSPIPMTLRLTVKCRKCDWCREQRRRLWARRALYETRTAFRTWFATLTLSPQEQSTAHSRAVQRVARNGDLFEALSFDVQFLERHRQINPLITDYLKRVRKQSEAPLRYLLVAEHHKSGLPHYHMLIHECDPARPVRKSLLQAQWQKHGFSQFKLVDDARQAIYVCKYLSKTTVARVRASGQYGQQRPIVIEAKPRVADTKGREGFGEVSSPTSVSTI